jgi:glycosyltransferase involved in cell wall biosynthesis
MDAVKQYTYFILTLNMRQSGGAERQISMICNRLPVQQVICLEGGVDHAMAEGKTISLSAHTDKTSAIWKLIFLPVYAWRLYRLVKKHRPLVIISFMERPNYVNLIVKPFLRHTAIISVRSNVQEVYKSGIKKLNLHLIKWLYRRADMITANAAKNTLLMQDFLQTKQPLYRTVPNAFDAPAIRQQAALPLSEPFKTLFDQHPVILNIGRMVPEKGQWHLLRIFQAVAKQLPGYKLVILGDGIYREALVKMAGEYGLTVFDNSAGNSLNTNADIFLMGVHGNPYQLMARSRLFALTSLTEGLPNALIEAIICGCPVIAADCPTGPREILLSGTDLMQVSTAPEAGSGGMLMPPFDGAIFFDTRPLNATEQLWVNETVRLLSDVALQQVLKQEAAVVTEKFNLERIILQWQAVLDEAAALKP